MEAQKHKKIKKQTQKTQSSNNPNKHDQRFKAMSYDPKFVAPNAKMLKVKIDKRFSKMMTNPEFKVSSAVDKYGREANP